MRILYVVHQFFPKYYTGTERLVLNLSKQMQRMGHSVKVLTYGITETEGFRQEGDFLIKDYEFQGVPVISIRHKIIPQDVSFTIFDPKMEKILGTIFSNEKFDIIHVCHSMRVGSIIRVAKHRNIPIVLTLTDFWLMCPRGIAVTQKGELCYDPEDGMKCVRECYGNLWKDKLIQRFNETNELFQVVDCVVCATNFLKQIYEINNFSSNIKLIRFGKDYRNVRHNIREYSENSEITLGFLSTLLPHKGAHVLLEAYNKANKGDIRLKIYGDYFGEIEYYNRLKKLAKENKKIEFCGKYKYEEIPDILDELDMIVVPSIWWENSPLILLRALAHNVPAIVSNLGGMTEVIKDGENGFAFEAGNSKSLAEVLRKIGENPSILNEMKTKIHPPPRIEEEAFEYEKIYASLSGLVSLTGDIPVPPKGLMFIGDGDFKAIGEDFVQYFIELCGLKPNERVLDVGCGVGRMAIPLTKYLDKNGSYEGFDIVKGGIDWCVKNISSKYPGFHFQVADIFNKYYNPGGKYKSCEYKFPYENESFDFIFLTSVFTHMFPQDMENYFSEITRVLRKRGRCFITFFLLNGESLKLIDAKRSAADFKYVFEGYYTTDKNTPEAAIGYDEHFIRKLYDKYGLIIEEPIRYGSWCGREKFLSYQDIIIASKD